LQSVALVVVAAGSSVRMDGRDKMWEVLQEKPLLLHSILTLAGVVSKTVVVVKKQDVARTKEILEAELPKGGWEIVVGGSKRQESVSNALASCAGLDSIAVHDAARPFATAALLRRVWEESRFTGAAIPAVPLADTIKRASGHLVRETVDRADLWAAQTPQVFASNILNRAYLEAAAREETATDDAHLVQQSGVDVRIVAGDPDNFKITTPGDLLRARILLQSRLKDPVHSG
jgi:2-C-methyl-D-erythritol 4-phosphate cytidylyltransferase